MRLALLVLFGCNADLDGDWLSNRAERGLGTDPRVADSDGDGLSDWAEVHAGYDPLSRDTDGDGVADGFEVERGLDPSNPDTDDDGFDDNEEIWAGTDGTDPYSWPVGSGRWPDWSSRSEGFAPTGRGIGERVEDLAWRDQFGGEVHLWQFFGSPVLLEYHTTWCVPCRQVAAGAEARWDERRLDGFTTVELLVDVGGSADAAGELSKWVTDYGIRFPVVAADSDEIASYPDFRGSIPFMVLLDRELRVDSITYSSYDVDELFARVDELLAEQADSE
jgi:thiol-disulfide isomerase/thioredoxin